LLIEDRYRGLRDAFDNITAKHIAEQILTCSFNDDAIMIKESMYKKRFDVLGIENEFGKVIGYLKRVDLKQGQCKDYQILFEPGILITNSTKLMKVLELMETRERLFMLEDDEVKGIITRGDLQKAPMRLMIFGILSILEMHLQREIENMYPNNSWVIPSLIKEDRVKQARELFEKSKNNDEDLTLLECTTFWDKCKMIAKTPKLVEELSKVIDSSEKKLQYFNRIRNCVAHPKNISRGSGWCDTIRLVRDAEELCKYFEN